MNAAAKLSPSPAKPVNRAQRNQGMNWIRQEKRLAIYLRDGEACTYCGATSATDIMTLDHLLPHVAGGTNRESNLVTCCKTCNSSRGDMALAAWLVKRCGSQAEAVASIIIERTATDLRPYLTQAKARRAA